MPGKPRHTRFSEMRHFAEGIKWNKCRIAPDLVPPIAAWLVMLSRRIQRSYDTLNNRIVQGVVIGADKQREYHELALKQLANITRQLVDPFARDEWEVAVREICELLAIKFDTQTIDMPEPGTLDTLIETPGDASDALRERTDDGAGGRAVEEPARPDGGRKRRRR